MQAAINRAIHLEQSGDVHAATIMAGFSLADIPAPCLSVIIVGKDQQSAQAAADTLADEIWSNREGFVYVSEPLNSSIAKAKEMAREKGIAHPSCGDRDGPILLLD